MPSLSVNDYTLEYHEHGCGESLIFVHGSSSDYRTWHRQHHEFGGNFRSIAYSRRYHWPNKHIPDGADYSMAEHVDDLRNLIRALKAEPAHLVGHSYGAFICLLLAIREPQLMRTLVLAEPPAITLFVSNKPKPGEILSLLIKRPRTALSVIKFGATGAGPATAAARRNDMEKVLLYMGTAVFGKKGFRRLSSERREQGRANTIKAEILGSGFAPLDTDRIQAVQIPTLLVTGEESPALFHRLIDRLEELLPQTKRITVPETSHLMHEENAPFYNEMVLSFLKEQRPAMR